MISEYIAYRLGRSSAERERDMVRRTVDDLPDEATVRAWRIVIPLLAIIGLVVLVFA